MVSDTEARSAVRRLLERLDLIDGQSAGLAYVLARRDRQGYERLLEDAEIAQKIVVGPLLGDDEGHKQVYRALSDANADWAKAVMAMLEQGPIEFTEDEAFRRLERMRSLDERFDEEMKKRNRDNGPKERGFGDWT